MQPMAQDGEGDSVYLRYRKERLADLRELITEHTAVVQELKDLHALYLDISGQPMDIAARRSKQSELVSAEVELVKQALDIQQVVHDILSQYRRLLP